MHLVVQTFSSNGENISESFGGLIDTLEEVGEIVAQIYVYVGNINELVSSEVLADNSFETFNEFFEGKSYQKKFKKVNSQNSN